MALAAFGFLSEDVDDPGLAGAVGQIASLHPMVASPTWTSDRSRPSRSGRSVRAESQGSIRLPYNAIPLFKSSFTIQNE